MYVVANYLPQFYETVTNNKIYCEGYTEWMAVKNAHAFFPGHNQPRKPLYSNYYSLVDADALKWQSELAAQYGVDCFAFYHYYFGSGKMELARPAELFLENKEIRTSFFFVWANESWGRKSKHRKTNQWTNIYDNGSCQDLFIEQRYDGINQYRKHFEYIRRFVSDSRYFRIDGRPVFAIYDTSNFEAIKIMMENWNIWAVEEGKTPFHYIGINALGHEDAFDSVLYQMPNAAYHYGVKNKELKNGVVIKSYSEAMDIALQIKCDHHSLTGTFVDFDNTPRYGNNHSLVFERDSVDLFEYYLRRIVKKNKENGKDFLFINAWNEWGEGNYLEPDEQNQFTYLETVRRVKRASECDLSIIIPAYNVEEYIAECLDSVLCQNDLSYEIICINDGSSDNTKQILSDYQKRNPDTIAVFNNEHLGVSEARNAGLDMALGKYIYYIDADDFLYPNALKELAIIIHKSECFDVCFLSFRNVCIDAVLRKLHETRISKIKRKREIPAAISGKDAFVEMWNSDEYYPLVWLQLARRSFLEDNNIRFLPDIIYEDQLYTFELLAVAERVLCYNKEIYNKRIRKGSICTNEKKAEYIISYLTIYDTLASKNPPEKRSKEADALFNSFLDRVTRAFAGLTDEEKCELRRALIGTKLESYRTSILKN